MSDGISFFSNEDIEKHLNIILTQTNYTKEDAIIALQKHNGDIKKVIKEYMGIPEKIKETKIKSVNQEIYKQLRTKLDSNMRDYHVRVEKGEAKKII